MNNLFTIILVKNYLQNPFYILSTAGHFRVMVDIRRDSTLRSRTKQMPKE